MANAFEVRLGLDERRRVHAKKPIGSVIVLAAAAAVVALVLAVFPTRVTGDSELPRTAEGSS